MLHVGLHLNRVLYYLEMTLLTEELAVVDIKILLRYYHAHVHSRNNTQHSKRERLLSAIGGNKQMCVIEGIDYFSRCTKGESTNIFLIA